MSSHTSRNIVLCSDGTGNKGGSGSDTNVFKLYQAVKINDFAQHEREQIVFYDNGVGTSKLSVKKAAGGALGLGFRQNVSDLYDFLGRNYRAGDDIYVFGFSRGSATVRALAGMLEHCGLVLKHPEEGAVLSEETFRTRGRLAMEHYADRAPGRTTRFEHGIRVDIEFMGVWDTVSALGTPQLPWLDALIDLVRRHKFFDYEPATCVKNVYHAVAVDDERRTFWPMIWNETSYKASTPDGAIEQVWFPGMHSNIGGGYPRVEVANVALEWMMHKLETHCARLQQDGSNRGLCLKTSARRAVRDDASAFGKIYDSRSGFKVFYRYQPRPIERLCGDKSTPIRIHSSVIDRLQRRTAGYTPGNLPADFELVSTPSPNETTPGPAADGLGPSSSTLDSGEASSEGSSAKAAYAAIRAKVEAFKNARIVLYWVFLLSSLAAGVASVWLWVSPLDVGPGQPGYESWRETTAILPWVEDLLRYVLPAILDGAITYLVVAHPWRLAMVLGYAVVLYLIRVALQIKMEGREEEARVALLERLGRPA